MYFNFRTSPSDSVSTSFPFPIDLSEVSSTHLNDLVLNGLICFGKLTKLSQRNRLSVVRIRSAAPYFVGISTDQEASQDG